jgi:prefoldin subunit 5
MEKRTKTNLGLRETWSIPEPIDSKMDRYKQDLDELKDSLTSLQSEVQDLLRRVGVLEDKSKNKKQKKKAKE